MKTKEDFRLQNPLDIKSKVIMLNFLRELGAEETYKKANKAQKSNMYYSFYDMDDKVAIDFNWEYLLFKATMNELDYFLTEFKEEIIEMQEVFKKRAEKIIKEDNIASINLMDFAKAQINKANKVNVI